MRNGDAELLGKIATRHNAFRGYDNANVILCELRTTVFDAQWRRAVTDLVSLVACMGFPTQVPLGAAALIASTARVSGFMCRRRRGAIDDPANNPWDATDAPFKAHLTAPLSILGKWPQEAISAFILQNDLIKETANLAILGPDTLRRLGK